MATQRHKDETTDEADILNNRGGLECCGDRGGSSFFWLQPVEVTVANPASNIPIEIFGLGTTEAKVVAKVGFEASRRLEPSFNSTQTMEIVLRKGLSSLG